MLLDHDYYMAVTGDTSSAPEVFATAASSAQELLEDALDRVGTLELGERTETLELAPGGYLYPTATPLISAEGGWLVRDNGLYGGTVDLGTFVGLLGSEYPPDATVTYVGGYSPATLPEYAMRDLAAATHAILHPPDLGATTTFPAAATSASVGDVSLGFGPAGAGGSSSALLPGISWSPETLKLKGTPPP